MNDPAAALLAGLKAFDRQGLSPGRSGNLSVRTEDGMLITPSAIAAADTDEAQLVGVSEAGEWTPGGYRPSSEWPMHLALYRAYPDCAAVVHCHSPRATALACLERDIPPFHYMVAAAGGTRIACAPYATFGSEALSAAALEAMGDTRACLLAHHGQIAWGHTMDSALELAITVESLADAYLSALSIAEPPLLGEAEMQRVLAAFGDYRPR